MNRAIAVVDEVVEVGVGLVALLQSASGRCWCCGGCRGVFIPDTALAPSLSSVGAVAGGPQFSFPSPLLLPFPRTRWCLLVVLLRWCPAPPPPLRRRRWDDDGVLYEDDGVASFTPRAWSAVRSITHVLSASSTSECEGKYVPTAFVLLLVTVEDVFLVRDICFSVATWLKLPASLIPEMVFMIR